MNVVRDVQKFRRSFKHSLNGLKIAWHDELNFRIQALFALAVFFAGFVLHVTQRDFMLLMLAICLMLAAETFNTVFEEVCDKIEPSYDPHIGRIKDLAAGAVLITSLPAFIMTIVILLPYVLHIVS